MLKNIYNHLDTDIVLYQNKVTPKVELLVLSELNLILNLPEHQQRRKKRGGLKKKLKESNEQRHHMRKLLKKRKRENK